MRQSLHIADGPVFAEPVERGLRRAAIPLSSIAAVAAAMLIYVSQAFLLTEMLEIKREMQALLTIPIAVAACYYFVARTGRMRDPLIAFAVVKLVTEIALRGQVSYILDAVAATFALTVLACVPAGSLRVGAKFLVMFAGIMALMALVQWVMIMLDPNLAKFVLEVSDDGVVLNTVEHPIEVLALHGNPDFSLLGHPTVRMQSFAKEPSLNVLYFMLPACLAFLMKSRWSWFWGFTILTYCVFSLSGSVFLTLMFCGLMWMFVSVTSVRFALPYGVLILMGIFLGAVQYFGLEPLMNAFEYLSQYGDYLNKGASLTDRTGGAVLNSGAALASPLGSSTISDIPGPWLINSALAAGWLGVLALVWFLSRLGKQLDVYYSRYALLSVHRFGSLLLLGSMATIIVFNDYQMGNYAGLVLLGYIYRELDLSNREAASAAHRRLARRA